MTDSLSILKKKTVADLTKMCESLGKKPPSSLRKNDIINFYIGLEKMKREQIPSTHKYTGDDLTYVPVYMELRSSSKNEPDLPEGDTEPSMAAAQPTVKSWRQHLQREGWATVSVLENPEETEDAFYTWLEGACDRFKRDDPSTWNNKNIPPNLHGIFKHFIGHTELVWKVREKCFDVFSEIWQTQDLLTSFDGGCFLPQSKAKKVQWIHNDHPRAHIGAGCSCIQGLVNIRDNGPEDGGLLLMEGSQHFFDEYMERHPIDGFGFCPADMDDIHLKQCRPIKICAKAGEIILWDGRIFHCNVSPVIENHLRMCIYVSMQPKIGASEAEIKRRISYYEKGRMTGHWCYGPYFLETGKEPRTYGNEIVRPNCIEIAPLNDLRKKLIGYN